ncbi:MAG: GntR family transcriptional regulator [Lachnospiraceae bacterium]|nr:GntR family transcriptional regulator [Lachnospiraceae bacterium]MBQ8549401.1 GntR family transcriptional regulator [Lachnospiraceae bacterium]
MVIRIDFGSSEALYVQLYNQIIYGIANAQLLPGDTLPSVRELADDIGINMHTVNKAYAILRQEGYLRLDRRNGAVIAVNSDKLRAMEQLKNEMRISLAKALCRGLSDEEIHAVTDEVLREFQV